MKEHGVAADGGIFDKGYVFSIGAEEGAEFLRCCPQRFGQHAEHEPARFGLHATAPVLLHLQHGPRRRAERAMIDVQPAPIQPPFITNGSAQSGRGHGMLHSFPLGVNDDLWHIGGASVQKKFRDARSREGLSLVGLSNGHTRHLPKGASTRKASLLKWGEREQWMGIASPSRTRLRRCDLRRGRR